MNMLVLGCGLVGREFERYGYECLDSSQFKLDVLDYSFTSFLEKLNYETLEKLYSADIIVNCIGYTNTKIETISQFNEALSINGTFPGQLAEFCDYRNKKLVHISTGDVYGDSERMNIINKCFKETDQFNLMTKYATTKYVGETLINNSKHLILRPRLIFGSDNLLSNILTKLNKYKQFTTILNSFTSTKTIVEATKALLYADQVGVFNVCNNGITTMIELAELYNSILGIDTTVQAASIEGINNVMDCSKLEQFYSPTPIASEFERFVKLFNG